MHEIKLPMIDCHTHLRQQEGMKAITALRNEEEIFGHENYCVLSLEGNGAGFQDQNALCLANKRTYPNTYAFGGINHAMGNIRAQAERLWEAGVDGFKMIEGKPDAWNRLKIPLDDSSYDEFYSFCAENGAPLLIHIADPEIFWDITKISKADYDRGWYCDETFPTKEYLTTQAISVMEKFPDMKIIFAHFLYLAEHLPRMESLFDKFPNMYADITPGAPLFNNFTDTYDDSVEFFKKYNSRILYGSDTSDFHNEGGVNYMKTVLDKIRRFVDTDDEMEAWDYRFKGLNLPDEVKANIFSGNFLRIVKHREINPDKAAAYFRKMLADTNITLSETEYNNITSLWG